MQMFDILLKFIKELIKRVGLMYDNAANAGLEGATSTGLMQNMILYLVGVYGLEMATGSNIIYFWSAATYFTIILGAFLADTFVGRFWVIGFGSILNLMGMMLLWFTTIIPGAGPSCNGKTTNVCTSTPLQLLLLCSSLWLMSLGSGGIRSSTVAFGGDQLVNVVEGITKSTSSKVLERFLNWYYISFSFACLFGLTCLVYIQDHFGSKVGFGVTFCSMFLANICFFMPSSYYVKAKPKSSLLVGFAQVLVASWKNRHYMFPCHETNETFYHVAQGSVLGKPSKKLRFLNKACIVKDPQQKLTPAGSAVNPWHLCTTDQVEELKSILRVIPIWSTGIVYGACLSQTSVLVLQANSMDRHFLSSSFEIPAGSFHTFSLVTIILWLVLYDRIIIPLASKAKGKPVSLHTKTRMGTGLLISNFAIMVAAFVEGVRREKATQGGKSLSALWLLPQVCLLGLGECVLAVAQIELYYTDLPKDMSSISSNLAGLSMTIASLVASLIMSLVDYITTQGGRQSWVSGDVNRGHYDYYYWVLAGLGVLNYMYFLVCSKAYWQHKKDSEDANERTSS